MRTGRIYPGEWTAAAESDHPVYHFQIQHQWGHGKTVWSWGIRIFLYTAAESDQWSCRSQDRSNGRRHSRNADLKRTGSELFCHIQYMWEWRPYRGIILDLRRNLQPHCSYACQNGDHGNLRVSWRIGGGVKRCVPSEHKADVWRDDRQSGIDRIRYWALCKNSTCARRTSYHRQHISNSGQLQTIWVGRGYCDTLHYQIHGWTWCGSGRCDRWQRKIRLDGARRQISGTLYTGWELPWRDLCRKIWQWGCIHHKMYNTADAWSRMHPVATERIPVKPWTGVAACAYA